MAGVAFFLFFLASGIWKTDRLLSKCPTAHKLWLGASLGMMEVMWLPSLFAFAMDFTLEAQLWAAGTSLLADIVLTVIPKKNLLKCKKMPLKALIPVVPMAALSLYLLHTHTLENVDGALYVGQSTYGDLCLHLGIATGLEGASYPPEYTILPGTMLGYPFLTDALSGSLLVLGSSLRMAFILPQFVQMVLIYVGFCILAYDWTEDARCAVVAFLLLIFNGGFGFLYINSSETLQEMLYGFYRAPCNMPDLNLRWSNLLCDLFIPQRTFTAGWCVLIPALFLLHHAMRTQDKRLFFALGIWAGCMPMVHTHSFLALGLLSVGAMVYSIVKSGEKKRTFQAFLCYGVTAVILALPQLLTWTFPQTAEGGSLRIWFNWVNNSGDGLIDNYFVFWIKNVGVVYLLMLPAFFTQDRQGKALSVGAAVIYIVAELVLFQPNTYDNNKLFYVAFMVMLPACAKLLFKIYDKIRFKGIKLCFLCGFLCVCMLSGGMSMVRECISSYQLFSADEAQAAQYLKENDDGGTVLTAFQHNNAPASLAGRNIVCGTGSYLYYHGVDYSTQYNDVYAMFEHPFENEDLFEKYNVTTIYVSGNERAQFAIDETFLAQRCEIVFDSCDVTIYRLL